ncbi:MAG TPA: hypothetical protein VFT53_00520 [Candidatus Saccharimonadales bacterium]|nr:hypothetical protein [Candidatus Saccharimonadales bacterium]
MAYETARPELQAVAGWLDTLAIPQSAPLYEAVLADCRGVERLLGQAAANAITRHIAGNPSHFLPMSSPSPDIRSYAAVGQRFGAMHVCVYENGSLSPDDAIVKTVGEKASTFAHYTLSAGAEALGGLYLPDDADAGYRPTASERKPGGRYSVLYIGENALRTFFSNKR